VVNPVDSEVPEVPATPEQPTQNVTRHRRPGISWYRTWGREIVEIIALVVIIYTLINLSTARAIVEGPSMQPNFYTGQVVIINRFAYYFSEPQRGDVIVLNNPLERCKDAIKDRNTVVLPFTSPDANNDECADLIKRVIGLPGETIEIKAGRVYINGTKIEEPYITSFCEVSCDKQWTLKDDEYFVLGDNRNNSMDSHSFGPINRHLIVGEAWIRYWPLKDAGVIPHPAYGTLTRTDPTATVVPSSQIIRP
jgi:signal peptidase I